MRHPIVTSATLPNKECHAETLPHNDTHDYIQPISYISALGPPTLLPQRKATQRCNNADRPACLPKITTGPGDPNPYQPYYTLADPGSPHPKRASKTSLEGKASLWAMNGWFVNRSQIGT